MLDLESDICRETEMDFEESVHTECESINQMEYQEFWLPMKDQLKRNVIAKISKGGTFVISRSGDFWIDEPSFIEDLLRIFTDSNLYRVIKKESGSILI